ncbi:lysyl-tRNA synthetase [Diaporthe amygdali]|uniref:lysyl-tRNA synthetase n=1 Tax=Phomopsis amygdali TaxID=1214568 RepID=UPI0022FDDD0F|nr:lysyl-tRNA synthetase [Diaporthe amygdali]KAJ0122450.1 lysyl-tRNA synthetase [Diaporthe amygdali]
MAPSLHFLRPYAFQPLAPASSPSGSAYIRFYELARRNPQAVCQRNSSTAPPNTIARIRTRTPYVKRDVEAYNPEDRGALTAARVKQLQMAHALLYPRLKRYAKPLTISNFRKEYEKKIKLPSETLGDIVTVGGRVSSISQLGNKLAFVKLVMDGAMVQGVLNINKMIDGTDMRHFTDLVRLIKRGDHISITGQPTRTQTKEFSIEAIHLPQIVSPGLAPLPYNLPEESRMNQRHLDLLVNKQAADTLRVRSCVIRHLRQWLETKLECIEVHTPILAANAGGAVARPFTTNATEFPEKQLALRIAPELWLKRLVVAGFDRIYEIGPAFRNEGIDSTHNPEFTMCEFYVSHINLEQVMQDTREMFSDLAAAVAKFRSDHNLETLQPPDPKLFAKEWQVVDFIPAINMELGSALPRLDNNPNAVQEIIKLLEARGKDWHKSLPPNPSLSKLLDRIAGAVLEPQSQGKPIFITKHPACMSPLAKTFTCPITKQFVSARAEVFFDGNELANMYEEENSPYVQRLKFVDQAKAKLAQQQNAAPGEQSLGDEDDEPAHFIDEQYVSVLESGLPPTAGWGCGVDRLVMMFTGAGRISEVLPFGNLRNVVGLASTGPQNQEHKKEDGSESDSGSILPDGAAGAAEAQISSREELEKTVQVGKETIFPTGEVARNGPKAGKAGPSHVIERENTTYGSFSDDISAAQADGATATDNGDAAAQESGKSADANRQKRAADDALHYIMGNMP